MGDIMHLFLSKHPPPIMLHICKWFIRVSANPAFWPMNFKRPCMGAYSGNTVGTSINMIKGHWSSKGVCTSGWERRKHFSNHFCLHLNRQLTIQYCSCVPNGVGGFVCTLYGIATPGCPDFQFDVKVVHGTLQTSPIHTWFKKDSCRAHHELSSVINVHAAVVYSGTPIMQSPLGPCLQCQCICLSEASGCTSGGRGKVDAGCWAHRGLDVKC